MEFPGEEVQKLPLVPTLGLVSNDVKGTKSQESELSVKDEVLTKESSCDENASAKGEEKGSHDNKQQEEMGAKENGTVEEMEIEDIIGSSELKESDDSKRPRLTLTLSKETSANNDYSITNGPDLELEVAEEKKKRKKHKKKKCLSMPRSYAAKLVEIQSSMYKLTSKFPARPLQLDQQRKRVQSLSSYAEVPAKSPPYSAPVGGTFHHLSLKGKGSAYRRRYMSSGSATETRRRLTRKKRNETEETGQIAAGEDEKKRVRSHLTENNVWSPSDDYRLLVNITQTRGNLEHVYAGTKFSCFYSFDDVAHRWETLLYDEKAGGLSQEAICNLHPVIRARIQVEALFSQEEEDLLRTIKNVPGGTPDISVFAKLLEENPLVFRYRTPRKLSTHWMEMKEFHLLEGQDVLDYKDPFSLYEFRDSAYMSVLPDMAVFQELDTESKLVKHQIRQLEEEIESWHCMQELVVSDGTSDLHSLFSGSEFDDHTYAVLIGKQMRYCMTSKEILIGRHSTNNKVDADLTFEGASGKVSRRQAVIQLRGLGEFVIINQGRSIFVDHVHVPNGGMTKLNNGCVIQISNIKLIFQVNEKLMRKELSHEIRREVLNARLKSLDPVRYASSLRPGEPLPSTSISPRKRTLSTAGMASPTAGLSVGLPSPIMLRAAGGRPPGLGPLTLPTPILGLNQAHMLPSYVIDSLPKGSSKPGNGVSTDGEIFKKPAPVSGVRSGTSKTSRLSMPSSPLASSSSSSQIVNTVPFAPISTVFSSQPITAGTETIFELPPVTMVAPIPSGLQATSQLDYTNLEPVSDISGLSGDVTPVTAIPDTEQPALILPASTPVSSMSEEQLLTSMRMPSLGLVKMENNS